MPSWATILRHLSWVRTPAFTDAAIWLAANVLGFVIPIVIGALIVYGVGDVRLAQFTDAGQFGSYAAAVMITTLYVVGRHSPRGRIRAQEWFLGIAIIGLCVGVGFVALGALQSQGHVAVKQWLLRWPSIALFGIALAAAFIATWFHGLRIPDPIDDQQHRLDDLEAAFEQTEQDGT